MAKLVDTLESAETVTLPKSGRIEIGKELPDGFDLALLEQEVSDFYGDRFVVDHSQPDPADAGGDSPATGTTRKRKSTRKAEPS